MLAAAAQEIYDEWNEEEPGGICDMISQSIADILITHNIESTEGGHDGDDHSYVIAYDDNESYIVDIPYSTYESGGGYNWQKLHGVVFGPNDVQVVECDRPDWIDDEY